MSHNNEEEIKKRLKISHNCTVSRDALRITVSPEAGVDGDAERVYELIITCRMDTDDLESCQLAEKAWKCPISSCEALLSRKQTLQSHLWNFHGITAGPPRKKYKLYETDCSVPVPRTTKFHQKKSAASHTEEDSSQASSISNAESLPFSLEVASTLDNDDSDEMDVCSVYDCFGVSDDESDDLLEAGSDEELLSSDEDNTTGPSLYVLPTTSQLYSSSITKSEHVLSTSAFCARHNLSDIAIKDMLQLIQLHIPENNTGETNINVLKDKLGFNKSYLKYHLYCDHCTKLFSDEEANCLTPGCEGDKTDPQCKKYFVTSNMKQQLEEILNRPGVWDSIESTKSAESGEAISDIHSGDAYKELLKPSGFLHLNNNITLAMFIDGVPLFKSSGIQIWPVYLLINEIPANERFTRKNMLLWGVWQGKGKPKMNMFLRPLVVDLNQLYKNGLSFVVNNEQLKIKAMLIVVTMDLQARAYFANQTQHNGMYGCLYCEEPGIVVESGGGTCRSYVQQDVPANMRTTQSITENAAAAQEDGVKKMGLFGLSVFHYLPYFSMVNHVVIDYMHGTLLGITKKLLELWFDPKHRGNEYFIGMHIAAIDELLLNIRPPYMISRLPRVVSSTWNHWKASELRNWLLFYSLPCLIGHLPEVFLKHFSCLVEATYILLSEGITPADVERADKLLKFFVSNTASLYGKNIVSLNVHNLTHLVPFVKMWGPLWSWSCFPFESFNGEIKKNVHGTGNVCKQIFWTFQAQKRILQSEQNMEEGKVKEFIHGMFSGKAASAAGVEAFQCRTTKLCLVKKKFTREVKDQLMVLTNSTTEDDYLATPKLLRNGFHLYSAACSKVKKQNSTIIALEQQTDEEMAVEVQEFLMHKESKHVFAVGRMIQSGGSVLEGYISHLHKLEYSNTTVVKAERLREPMITVKTNGSLYGALLPNHFESD